MQRGRHRRGKRGRTPSPVFIEHPPKTGSFTPDRVEAGPPIELNPAELEALRLVDLEGLSQKSAGTRMGVSRGTVWRLLHEARRKVAEALSEGRTIKIIQE